MKLQSHALSHVGRRQNNEDAFCLLPRYGVFAVADGMGGYEGGEVASKATVTALSDFFSRHFADPDCTLPYRADGKLSFAENLVSMAVRSAHDLVCGKRKGALAQMGSTVVTLLCHGHRAIIGHVGDSRLYRLRAGTLTLRTRDHSLYNEMAAAGMPDLPPKERSPFAHIITKALGVSEDATPELSCEELLPGDTYLLCTDGLSEHVPEESIALLLSGLSPRRACEELVEMAYARGSRDNITALVVRVIA